MPFSHGRERSNVGLITVPPNSFLTEEEQAVTKSTVAVIVRSGQFRLESDGSTFTLPPYALQKVVNLLDLMAEGQDIDLFPALSEWTVSQAAKYLRMSERHLNDLLDAKRIAFRLEGGERLIQRTSLLEFELERERKHAAVDEIVRMSQEMGLYDD